MSYSEFASYESISDEEEREARIYEFEHFKQAAYYSHDHHTTHEVEMDQKNVDYIIAKAEEKRRRMYGPEEREQQYDHSLGFKHESKVSASSEKQDR